jgi:predicted ATP-grasp superfamily ATP-dependent carboligase
VREILDARPFVVDPGASLRQLAARHGAPPVLLPCTDEFVLWLSTQRDVIAGLGSFVLASKGSVQTLVDKTQLYRFALAHGLSIAPTRFLSQRADVESAAATLGFPVVLKPALRTAAWLSLTAGRKVLRIESPAALLEAWDRYSGMASELVVQEWIPGSDQHMFSLYSHRTRDGRVPGYVVVQKLRQWPPDTGVGSLAVQVENEAVAALGLELLSRAAFAGLSSVQIKRHADNGSYAIIEVNAGRPALNMPVAELCGVEMQMSYYCEAAGLPLPDAQTVTHPGGKWMCWKTDLASAWCRWRRGDLGFGEWWRSISGRKVNAVWSGSDPLPFVLDVLRRLFTGRATSR